MVKYNEHTEMGFRALKRAAIKAYEEAKKNNLKVPIWKNNRVEYIDPSVELDDSKPEN